MDRDILKTALLELSATERRLLMKEVEQENLHRVSIISDRRAQLDNKQGTCPHCGSFKYTKFGEDKGSKRYRCKECKRTFTEYTGTWLSNIHKKEIAADYIKQMHKEKSLDKIKDKLKINKKTAFDWRHKILTSTENIGKGKFYGITESDETFFLFSEKGTKQTTRCPRKRGGRAKKKGISDEQVAVIVTADRISEMDIKVARLGRIRKVDIQKAIGEKVTEQTILCTDSHVSYKGFAKDKKIEHHPIRANLKQFVKQKIYHVQHVNSIDSRMKKWIEYRFMGVSTKYLQNYMNWFKSKEMFKNSPNPNEEFTRQSLENVNAWKSFKTIPQKFEKLVHLSTRN
jgi:transposase-like protein